MRYAVDSYYEWLLEQIDFYEQPIYWKACDTLFQRPYYSTFPMDENRAHDGARLRSVFCEETGSVLGYGDFDCECTVLEMMIGLAHRIEFDNMHDPDLGDRTHEWFWAMFNNLGLDAYDDYMFDEADVNNIVDIFLERRYDRHGNGSLFTITNPNLDARKLQIWYQAQHWLQENYY